MDGTLRVGLVGLLFAVVLAMVGRGDPPAQAALTEASGALTDFQRITGKGNRLTELRLALEAEGPFEYSRKAGSIADVAAALESAGPARITVRAYADSPGTVPVIYELAIGAQVVRPYADVARSWRSENRIARISAVVSALVGLGALLAWLLKRKRTQ